MISLWVVTWLLVTHFVGDFLLQSNWMALNKSKNATALVSHTTIYSLCFLWAGWEFAFVTWWFHTLTDAFTSQLTSKLWFVDLQSRGTDMGWSPYPYYAGVDGVKRFWFWRVIGLDQLLHGVTLIWTYNYLAGL